MKQEIERKFLLINLPDLSKFKTTQIAQFYISTKSENEVRVRREDSFNFYIQAKSKGDLVRKESRPISITFEDYMDLEEFKYGRTLRKIRYSIPYFQYIIEVDIYLEELNGLKTAEIEFPSVEEAKAFKPLDWFGKEITEDKRYKNRNLVAISEDEIKKTLKT